MNWTKALIAGLVAGIVMWIADFIMHGMILGPTYAKYPVFTQTQANPVKFLLIAVCIAITIAILFARTRESWKDGVGGGATFGFFVGLVYFFHGFYNPLVLEDFPYYLSWAWGGTYMVDAVVAGIVIALIYKRG